MKHLGRMLFAIVCCAACGPSERIGNTVDAPPSVGSGDAPSAEGTTFVFAHTDKTLYKVDPDSLVISKVGDFQWSTGDDQMTDIAIDKNGQIIGVSFTAVYSVDPITAKATQLSDTLDGDFNGLSFVPADQLGRTGDDVLVGTRHSDGLVFEVNPMTGAATQIGNMGTGFASSGDLVSVAGFGTALTASPETANDRLARLAAHTFTATQVGTDIGYVNIYGLAYWKNRLFGFTEAGQFILIDPATGTGTVVQSQGPAWWGAAVTTTAPVIE